MGVGIIEGLTGTGKTSVIGALRAVTTFELIDEETTFDDFAGEFFANAEAAAARATTRMAAILDNIEAQRRSKRYILERFYFTHLALGSPWSFYRDLNQRCEALNAKVILLVLPEEEIAHRSLYRAEHGDQDWQGLLDHYGSEQEALRALSNSQAARIRAVAESRLEHRIVNTSGKQWHPYAVEIAEWLDWRTEP
ncbi:MAG TPA: hypothetical protein VHR97_11010 [Candidatus Baltobacteraceae bacterium]|jgi:adenylate kinase|nr:hypothetical protein [Candidatus Baltobacteraceae bacterium]